MPKSTLEIVNQAINFRPVKSRRRGMAESAWKIRGRVYCIHYAHMEHAWLGLVVMHVHAHVGRLCRRSIVDVGNARASCRPRARDRRINRSALGRGARRCCRLSSDILTSRDRWNATIFQNLRPPNRSDTMESCNEAAGPSSDPPATGRHVPTAVATAMLT